MAKSFSDYKFDVESKRFTTFENKQTDLPVFAKGCEPFNFMPHVRDMAKQADLTINGLEVQLAMTRDDVDRMLKQRNEIDLLVSDLISDRGEDELIEVTCNKILHFIRR
jgi:hypothetical protein